jgi:methionyl-tRNA formyltransferase
MVSAAAASLRIVFFGTPDFAVPTLRGLHASRHPVVGIVTQPDRARGRGLQPHPSPVREFALDHSLQVLQPERLRDEAFLSALRDMNADLGVVAAYGKILTDAVLHTPRLGMINVHASLLPKYRGAAPVHRAVMAGESQTGITIMRVVKELDAGPMLSVVTRPIDPNETSREVEADLAQLGAVALVSTVTALAAGTATEEPQDESLATYARKLEKADGIIDWSQAARTIHNQIRGLHPWPHAFSDLEGERVILLRSEVEADVVPTFRSAISPSATEAGTIVEAIGEHLKVQTGRGMLRLLVLQREGKRPVSAREFISGRRLHPGSKFVRSHLPR